MSPLSQKYSGAHDGLRVRLVSVGPSRFFGMTEVWADSRTRVLVTDRERTVLDLFIDRWKLQDHLVAPIRR